MSILATAIGTFGPAVAKYFGAQAAAKNNRQDPTKIGAEFDQLQADTPNYEVDPAYVAYKNAAMQDPAGDQLRKVADQNLAGNVDALKAGGAKALLGGLSKISADSQNQRAQIEADSFGRKQDALLKFGAASQRVTDANTASDRDFAKSKFGAVREANLYNEKLDAAANQAPWDALGAGLGMFGQGMLGGKTDLSTDFEGSGFENLTGRSFGAGAFGGGGGTLQSGHGVLGNDFEPSKYRLNTLGFTGFTGKQGGMITPGEFSHETNPIDMIKDGVKIGELTGGEAVLNELQQEEVAKQSPIFRKLMREFAKKDAMKAKK
jgi:hypothetical protein